MSQSTADLQNEIIELVSGNRYSLAQLIQILKPVGSFVNDEKFISNVTDLVTAIIKDRNGDNKFTVDDLELLSHDYLAIANLATSLILIIGALPNVNLQYQQGTTEEVLFKLLVYVFLVIIPEEVGIDWTVDEKIMVVKYAMAMYNVILSSKITQEIITTVVNWFKSKGLCKCCSVQPNTEEIMDKHLSPLKVQLQSQIGKNRVMVKKSM